MAIFMLFIVDKDNIVAIISLLHFVQHVSKNCRRSHGRVLGGFFNCLPLLLLGALIEKATRVSMLDLLSLDVHRSPVPLDGADSRVACLALCLATGVVDS